MAESKEQVAGDQSYFDGMEGAGLGEMTGNAVSTAYLSMVQPGSTASASHNPGSWRNSVTDENYGPAVRVVPVAFKTVWTERDSAPPYMTVGRYEPGSINVDIVRPKPGTRGFPTMKNPETGNKIEELFIYAVMLEENPEAGILYFSPTSGSMRACKTWNSLLRSQRLPNGRLAPIFAFSWELNLHMFLPKGQMDQPANYKTRFDGVTRGVLVTKDLFQSYVQPQLAAAQNIAMLAAPEQSGDTEPEGN